jgi:hypothetical protein
MRKIFKISFCIFMLVSNLSAQQVPDFGFDPIIKNPEYSNGKGPLVLIDEAHYNFHTKKTRYFAFAKVLERDGYKVDGNTKPFSEAALKDARILVIANALHPSDTLEWIVPNPSAFSQEEIKALVEWVKKGGSLFFIADHMPIAGAGEELAKAFGFTFYNGFATDTTTGLFPGAKKELDIFRKSNNTLATHPVTNNVDHVATFTGQAFQIPDKAVSLLTFDEKYKVLLPDTAWKFHNNTRRLPVKGFSQGAVLEYGKGRIAVFGEAAMFSSQLKGKDKIHFGLSAPEADQNLQFLLNLIHWLDNSKK